MQQTLNLSITTFFTGYYAKINMNPGMQYFNGGEPYLTRF